MEKMLASILVSLTFCVVNAAAQRDYCFKNDGLKVTQTVSFTVTGNKVEGTMESGSYDNGTSAETFAFTGKKTGPILTIKFARKPPYEPAHGSRTIKWTLGTGKLKIPMYGKNYVSMKYSNYIATFARCKEI